MSLLSTQTSSCCPLCGSAATRIHSRYHRKLADLPSAGQPVRFLLSVRKFFCDVPTCPRKIFTERLAPFVAPKARVTQRLFQIVQVIGLATGGRLGVRVTDRLGIQTTRQTILRRIMALPTVSVGQVVELGIDDFSFRRGRKFGTILVNMQTRQVIDVLADRKAETSATWMASHPEIELVSRDRGGDYASAAATGAPQAVQCADRFHILKNLGEALEGCLSRHLAAKRHKQTQEMLEEHNPIWEVPRSARRSPKVERRQQAYREERLACYEQVLALHKLWHESSKHCRAGGNWPQHGQSMVGGSDASRDHARPLCESTRSLSALSLSAMGVGLPQYGGPVSRTGRSRLPRLV